MKSMKEREEKGKIVCGEGLIAHINSLEPITLKMPTREEWDGMFKYKPTPYHFTVGAETYKALEEAFEHYYNNRKDDKRKH